MSEAPDLQQLTQQLTESKRKIDLIRTVTLELNKVLGLREKLYNILEILYRQFHINYSMMLMPDEEGNQLVVQCSYGYENDHVGFTVPVGSGVIGMAALKKIPINITGLRRKKYYLSVTTEQPPASSPKYPGLENPESQIAIPMVSNNELVAVLLAESYNMSVFSKEDELFLITLSQSIAVSIQNAVLFDNMEAIIAKRTEELRKSNHTKDRLFSVISHDLRGPITSFHHISKLVSHYNKQNETEKINQLTQRIDDSVNKLNNLLDNLLNWALTQTKEIQCRPEKLNLVAILQEVVEIYTEQLDLKKLHLSVSQPSAVFISADYHMISVVFRNLLSNAIKYTPRDGSITLRTTTEAGYACVEVSDTGIGITPDKLTRIFEPDDKKSTRGTENEKGTGLGLLVAYEFMLINKGSIAIESNEKGTNVCVKIPSV